MAEGVVSEAIVIQEKGGLEASSYQDLQQRNYHGTNGENQTNDLDNSYVLITGSDVVDNKDGVADGLSVSPGSKFRAAAGAEEQGALVDKQNVEPDSVSGETSDVVNVEETGNTDCTTADPSSVSHRISKHENALDDGGTAHVLSGDSLENIATAEGSAEAEPKKVEDPDGKSGSLTEAAEEKLGDGNGYIDDVPESERYKKEELIEPEILPGPVDNQEYEVGAIELVVESVENGHLNNGSLHVTYPDYAAEESSIPVENLGYVNGAVVESVEDPDGKVGSLSEAAEEKFCDENGYIDDVPESERYKKEELIIPEILPGPVDNQEYEVGAIEPVVESVGNGHFDNGSIQVTYPDNAAVECDGAINLSSIPVENQESKVGSIGAVVESVENGYLNNSSMQVTYPDNATGECDGTINLSSILIENQEHKVEAIGAVVESVENEHLNNGSLQVTYPDNAIGECDVAINLSSFGDLKDCQASETEVLDVVVCEAKDGMAENEAKLKKEVVENAQHEHKVIESEVPRGSVENKGSHVGTVILATDSGENGKLDNSSLHFNGSCDGGVACEMAGNAKQEEKVEDFSKSEPIPGPSMEQESELGALGLDAESGKNEAPHSAIDGDADSELDDQSNLGANTGLALDKGSQGEVLDVAEYGLEDNQANCEVDLACKLVDIAEQDEKVEHLTNSECSYAVGNQGSLSETRKSEKLSAVSSRGDGSDTANYEGAKPIKVSTPETSEACQRSQEAAEDLADCGLPDVSEGAHDQAMLEPELVESAEPEAPASTSLDTDTDSCCGNKKEGTLEAITTSSSLALEKKRYDDIAVSVNIQDFPRQVYEANPASSSTGSDVGIGRDLVYHADHSSQCDEEPAAHTDGNGVPHESETKSETSVPTQSIPASNDHSPQIEVEFSYAEALEAVCSSSFNGSKPQINGKRLPENNSWIRCTNNVASSESDSKNDRAAKPLVSNPLSHDFLTNSENFPSIYEVYAETECSITKDKAANGGPATSYLKAEPELHIHKISSFSNVETRVVAVSEVCNSSPFNKLGAANIETDIQEVEDKRDLIEDAAGIIKGRKIFQANDKAQIYHADNVIEVAPEASNKNTVDRDEAGTKTKPFNFLIKIPKFDDENLGEQIRLAKVHVDEKTKFRDAIQVQIQQKRINSQIHGMDYEYAKSEVRNAKKMVKLKRIEIDSLQPVVNKARNALSIEDIDIQTRNLENRIQHETLSLKEEKLLVNEIKQLKQIRDQLSSSLSNQGEIKQVLEQREEVEERLKILRKELDILKDSVLKAEAAAVEAGTKYDDENKEVWELQSQFRAANDVRQAAYVELQSLREDFSKKNKHFFKYKDDARVASTCAFRRDTEALYRLCLNQVENFMELWNTNDEFRREYTKYNARSIVRRFGTLDGRTLGPDEKSHVVPSERVNRIVSRPDNFGLGVETSVWGLQQETTAEIAPAAPSNDKSTKEVPEKKYQKAVVPVEVNNLRTDIINEVHEEPQKSNYDIESILKAEETRKAESESKLKEQRRLEGLAKASEARERKKRQLEKSLMRAELKTQKEAEQKEKEREKRLRKKERMKAADNSDISNNGGTTPNCERAVEISKEIQIKDSSCVPTKKTQKPWFSKHTKTKSVPPSLRNRNKKKWQQWMWVGITSLAIFALFYLGNMGVFTNVNLRRRSTFH